MKQVFVSVAACSAAVGAVALALLGFPKPAQAVYTECPVTLSSFAVGEGGLNVGYTNGGSSFMTSSDDSYREILSLITELMVSKKTNITVRYTGSSGVSCNATSQRLSLVRVVPQ